MRAKRRRINPSIKDAGAVEGPVGRERLRKVVRSGLALSLLIPFVVTPSLAFPFVTGKALVFRSLISALIIPWVLLLLRDPGSRPRTSPVLLSVAIQLGIMGGAAWQGANAYRSFWSTFERMEGVVLQIYLFVFILMVVSVFRGSADWERIFKTGLFISVLLAGHAFMEKAGVVPMVTEGGRVSGRFGNPIFLAAFMMFFSIIGVFCALEGPARSWTTRMCAAAVVTDLLALYLTRTRGAVLGLIAGTIVACLIVVVRSPGQPRRIGLAVLAGLVTLGGVLYSSRGSGVFPPGAGVRILDLSPDDSIRARLLVWGVAIKAVKERPMFGLGHENFGLVLEKHYDAELWRHEAWFDRAHNVLLDWLVAAGVIGALAYLALFALALWVVAASKTLSTPGKACMAGLVFAIFVAGLFSFESVSGHLLLAMLLAYLHTLWNVDRPSAQRPGIPAAPGSQVALLSLATLIVGSSVQSAILRPWKASEAMALAAANTQAAPWQCLDQLQQSIDLNTAGRLEATRQLLHAALDLSAPGSSQPPEVRDAFLASAEREMSLRASEDPGDARSPLLLGLMLVRLGHPERGLPWLERANLLSPRRQTVAQELGNAYLVTGLRQRAFDVTKASYELSPSNIDMLRSYIVTAIFANRQDIFQQGAVDDATLLDPRIIGAAGAAGDAATLDRIWRALVKREARSGGRRIVSRASAFRETGENEKATQALESAGQADPDFQELAEALSLELRAPTNRGDRRKNDM